MPRRCTTRFNYPHIAYMDAAETAERLGSTIIIGGVRDTGTGHIHPLKLVIGTARVAAEAGAQLFENTKADRHLDQRRQGDRDDARRARSRRRKCLIAVECLWRRSRAADRRAHHADRLLHRRDRAARRRQPGAARRRVGSTIRASSCAISAAPRPASCCSADARSTRSKDPKDIHIHIRRQITEIYPALKDVEITHGWGGFVGITMPRKPFVREVMPNVISAGGYSGHGVMLSNFMGKLYAETVAGNRDRLKLFEELKIPPFPGGRRFRAPLLFLALNWYALQGPDLKHRPSQPCEQASIRHCFGRWRRYVWLHEPTHPAFRRPADTGLRACASLGRLAAGGYPISSGLRARPGQPARTAAQRDRCAGRPSRRRARLPGGSPDAATNIKSASKSIISALVGIAIEKGVLEGVDQKIAPIACARPAGKSRSAHPRDHYRQPLVHAGRARPHVGAELRPLGVEPQLGAGSTRRAVRRRSWRRMLYSTGSTHLLSAILTRASGRSTRELAREWLGPVEGFSIGAWDRDPQGIYVGGNQMAMTARSLLAFGELYRNGGRNREGEQVVPESWVAESWRVRTASRFSGDGYGYGWFQRADRRAGRSLCLGLRRADALHRAGDRADGGDDVTGGRSLGPQRPSRRSARAARRDHRRRAGA